MGLFLQFLLTPTPRSFDIADYGLPARVDMDMLDRDLLLALAAMLVERLQQCRPGTRELICLIEVLAPSLGRSALRAWPGGSIPSRCCVCFEQLCSHHAFQLVLWSDAGQGDERGPLQLAVPFLIIRVVQPQRLQRLIRDGGVPIVGLRAADTRKRASSVFPIVGDDGRRCLSLGEFPSSS